MTDEPQPWRDEPSDPQSGPGGQTFSQNLKHTAIGARVPDGVRAGVFCTGTTILQTSEEFVIDFLATMVPPQQVAARVVLTPNTFTQMIGALQANLAKYQKQFGRLGPRVRPDVPPPAPGASQEMVGAGEPIGAESGAGDMPSEAAAHAAGGEAQTADGAVEPGRPQTPAQPRIEDLYEQLKLPDEQLGGVYANVVMIRHTPEEFCFDFIANFFPRPVVTCRVFMSAGRVPSLLDAMQSASRRYHQRPSGPPPL
ncbi:MAG: DUF3467 domain-containing protein [Thermoguttaceae bacterium]